MRLIDSDCTAGGGSFGCGWVGLVGRTGWMGILGDEGVEFGICYCREKGFTFFVKEIDAMGAKVFFFFFLEIFMAMRSPSLLSRSFGTYV
jgi:hypothetical protein